MQILYRPRGIGGVAGRMVCGVAAGFALRYGLRANLLRVFFVVTMLLFPIGALLYLLLAISMPSELHVIGSLRLSVTDGNLSPRERFEMLSEQLLKSNAGRTSDSRFPTHLLGIGLLLFAAILILPRMEGDVFYMFHPIITTFLNFISRVGPAIFYIAAALLFLLRPKRAEPSVILLLPTRESFSLERGSQKMIGGIVSGAAQVLKLDPTYLRILLILLNFFTLGIAGAGYLLLWFFQRKKEGTRDATPEQVPEQFAAGMDGAFRSGIALLGLLLACISICTEYRIFFFNESLVQGCAMALMGIAFSWHGLRATDERGNLGIVGGASIFLFSVYQIVSAMTHLEITVPEEFQMWEIILALAMVYLALVALERRARRLALMLTILLAISAALITLNLIPPRYLMDLIRFYGFFYPVLFAALGLWIAFER